MSFLIHSFWEAFIWFCSRFLIVVMTPDEAKHAPFRIKLLNHFWISNEVSGSSLAWSRTPASQAGNPGSNPGYRTILYSIGTPSLVLGASHFIRRYGSFVRMIMVMGPRGDSSLKLTFPA